MKMTEGDTIAVLIFGSCGVWWLFSGNTVLGAIFLVIAAAMVGIAIGKDPDNK